jgi:DNA modification methylase
MMAAHQLGRRCYAIELDPKYCDVIVKRYERFTGEKAELCISDAAK